jgi:DNA-binding HxlR family transcriptional regulator
MPRSLCPVNLALELVGDRWSLLIVRDLMFSERRHYRDLLQMDEGISNSILANRLRRLTEAGLIVRSQDPSHSQKGIYSLTSVGVDLLPVVVALGIWGRHNTPASNELSVHVDALERGGASAVSAKRDELLETHQGAT